MDQPSFENQTRIALESLRAGNPQTALELLRAIVEAGGNPPWLAMAQACHLLGDSQGEEEALQRQLDQDKRDLPALLAMGELKAKGGDSRAAGAFFKAALNMAAAGQPPPQLMPLLNRAR